VCGRVSKAKLLPVGLLCLLVLLNSCGTLSESPSALQKPGLSRKGLAVLNFRNATSKDRADRFQPWEHGLAAMVVTDIQSVGGLNIVSRDRLKDILDEQAFQYSGLVDPDTAVRLGKMVAAHYILTGSFTEINGELRLEAQLFSVEEGRLLDATSVNGATERFFELEKEMVFNISKHLKIVLSADERTKLAGTIETKSVNASLSNYAGEIAVTKADELRKQGKTKEAHEVLEGARNNFKKALSFDPDYDRAKRNLSEIIRAVPLTL